MKKTLLTIIAFVSIPFMAGATPSQVDRESGFIQPLINTDYLKVDHITATSTTATNTFANDIAVGSNILLSRLNGEVTALQVTGGNTSGGINAGGLFGSITNVGSYDDGSLSGGSSGQCLKSIVTATQWGACPGSFAFPFTPSTNYSQTEQATTGIAWFENGMNASSTSHFELINVASTTGTSVFAGSASFGPNINMTASTGQIGASQVVGINSGSGLSAGGLFDSFFDSGTFSDGSISVGTLGQCLKSTVTKTQWATCFSLFASSTNPSMATYFVATSTTQASLFPYASTTALSSSNLTSGNCVQAGFGGLLVSASGACGSGSGSNFWTNSGANTYLNTGSNAEAPVFTATSSTGRSNYAGSVFVAKNVGVGDGSGMYPLAVATSGPTTLNGSPEEITLGGNANSPSQQEGIMTINGTTNGDHSGNMNMLTINAYEGTTGETPNPFIQMNSWSGTGTSSPGVNSFFLAGAQPWSLAQVQGSFGMDVRASGGAYGQFNAGTVQANQAMDIQGTGLISDDGSGNITGMIDPGTNLNTYFTDQIAVGDVIDNQGVGGQSVVTSISDDSEMTVSPPFSPDPSGDPYDIQKPFFRVGSIFNTPSVFTNNSGLTGLNTYNPQTLLDVAGDITDENVIGAPCVGTNSIGTFVSASCGSGTVSSVGLSSPNSTLNIGSTPVTTSGTISSDLNLTHTNWWTARQNLTNASTSELTATSSAFLASLNGTVMVGHNSSGFTTADNTLQVTGTSAGSLLYPLKVQNTGGGDNSSVGIDFDSDGGSANRAKGAIIYSSAGLGFGRGTLCLANNSALSSAVPTLSDCKESILNTGQANFNNSVTVATTSSAALSVKDAFGTNVLNVNTSSSTGPILTVQATSSPITLFSIDQYGNMLASTTIVSSIGSCGAGGGSFGTNSNGVVGDVITGTAATSCVINYNQTFPVAPRVFVTGSSVATIVGAVPSTTGFTINLGTAATGDDISYFVIQP